MAPRRGKPGSRRGWITKVALALLGMGVVQPGEVQAQADAAGTKVAAVIPAATADIGPGLCIPGDTPTCVGPDEAQIHLYSLACTATGTFEGRRVSPDGACGIDLSAFMLPSVEGFTKPTCLTSHTYTSDAARRFGKPVNEATVDGQARKIEVSYPAAVLGFRTATGWMDGPDRDSDPTGDHRIVFSIQARAPQSSDVPCVSKPFTRPEITAVMHIG
jgi:hypothetical protein